LGGEAVRDETLDLLCAVARDERCTLTATARREGLSAEEALECVQESLCAYLDRPSTDARDKEQTLRSLKAMVRNAARNFRRRHRRAKPHLTIDVGQEPASPGRDSEAIVTQAEELVRLRACVAELCEVQRAVVTLRLLEERSGEDVAQALGLARGHVDVLVHRAKAALRVCMAAAS
jgi:RNA polymerase sigma-70 factor (ECF subfamily)